MSEIQEKAAAQSDCCLTNYLGSSSLLVKSPDNSENNRYGTVAAPLLRRGASLEFKGELKRCTTLSMVGDEKCLVLFHGLGQLLKVSLSELSRQEVCPAIRMHRILHHPLVVIR